MRDYDQDERQFEEERRMEEDRRRDEEARRRELEAEQHRYGHVDEIGARQNERERKKQSWPSNDDAYDFYSYLGYGRQERAPLRR